MIGRLANSRARIAVSALLSLLVIGALEYGSHTLASDSNISREAQTLLDAGLMGLLAAVIVVVVLTGVRARRAIVYEQIRMVAELNHHVRNALEVIVSSTYLVRPENMTALLASVERIESTLNGLFPAMSEHDLPSAMPNRTRQRQDT